MNPWSSHVQVWICSVSICSSAGEMTVTPLSHPSVAIWQPPIYINKAAVSHAIHQPFSFSYPYHVDVQNLQSVVCPIKNWKQIKNAGKMVEIACKWRYLSTGKLHGASVRASPGSCAFLWALAEFEACLRSPWPSWLPTLCHISCGWTHSAAGPARFRTEEVHLPWCHKHFAQVQFRPSFFPSQPTWVHQFPCASQHLQILPVSGSGQGQKLFWDVCHLEKCCKPWSHC